MRAEATAAAPAGRDCRALRGGEELPGASVDLAWAPQLRPMQTLITVAEPWLEGEGPAAT